MDTDFSLPDLPRNNSVGGVKFWLTFPRAYFMDYSNLLLWLAVDSLSSDLQPNSG